MARPLVLKQVDHPTIWTPVYADVEDPKMTDWLWEQDLRRQQKIKFINYRNGSNERSEDLDQPVIHETAKTKYRLMTSVSTPVYDTRSNAVSFINFASDIYS